VRWSLHNGKVHVLDFTQLLLRCCAGMADAKAGAGGGHRCASRSIYSVGDNLTLPRLAVCSATVKVEVQAMARFDEVDARPGPVWELQRRVCALGDLLRSVTVLILHRSSQCTRLACMQPRLSISHRAPAELGADSASVRAQKPHKSSKLFIDVDGYVAVCSQPGIIHP
jgi:hypothetical protein